MNLKLKRNIDILFENAPENKKVTELKEEIMNNANEKFNDLTTAGMDEDEAIHAVMAGIGDVEELLEYIKQNTTLDPLGNAKQRKSSALVMTISVALYFLSLVTLIFLSTVVEGEYAFIIAALIAAVPTCLLIYHYTSKPHYNKADESMVEEFKEWKSIQGNRKKVRSSVSSLLWTVIALLYFVVSFITGAWYITWVIFIIGAVLESILTLIFSLKG